jgi:hypothetical protein
LDGKSDHMKIFGYVQARHEPEGLVELSEVTFQASPEVLREVAAFMVQAAKEIEQQGSRFSHSHIQDAIKSWRVEHPERADVVIASEP